MTMTDLGTEDFAARFVIVSLAVWRVTHLLVAEDGPWDLIVKVRLRLRDGFWGRLMDCFYCVSVWIAAPFAFAVVSRFEEAWLVWLALSGAACLLERATAAPVVFQRSKED